MIVNMLAVMCSLRQSQYANCYLLRYKHAPFICVITFADLIVLLMLISEMNS